MSGPLSLAFLATETQETAGSAGSCCPLSRARPSPPDAETTASAFYLRFMNVFQSEYLPNHVYRKFNYKELSTKHFFK